jgi:hypothetical protein
MGNAIVKTGHNNSTSDLPSPSVDASLYFLKPLENICVVCGNTNQSSFQKHAIVPHIFRRYYPAYIKSHNSYDVMQLCIRCHLKAETGVHVLMKDIDHEFNNYLLKDPEFATSIQAKIHVEDSQIEYINRVREVNKAARALHQHHQHRFQLPSDKLAHFENVVLQFYKQDMMKDVNFSDNITTMNDALIKDVMEYCQTEITKFSEVTSDIARNHYGAIIDYVPMNDQEIAQQALHRFSVRWRRHFLDYVNPQFLSKHWNPEYDDSRPRDCRSIAHIEI